MLMLIDFYRPDAAVWKDKREMTAMTASAPASMRYPTRLPAAVVVLGVAAATICGAWIFQAAGYAPCELCLKERLPYYAGIGLAAAAALAAWRGPAWSARLLLATLALLFAASAVFGAYHAGVEWGFWPGPSDCTGTLEKAGSMSDFMHQLQTVKVVRCDAVAIRILGLSLAGWNAVISAALAVFAGAAAARGSTLSRRERVAAERTGEGLPSR